MKILTWIGKYILAFIGCLSGVAAGWLLVSFLTWTLLPFDIALLRFVAVLAIPLTIIWDLRWKY